MFSGGLDSTILAALLCELLPPSVGLDLVNVSFSPQDSPDRITAILSFYELCKRRANIKLICADYSITDVMENQDIK
jgi:asparagine synthetase B (glutamine-hydrolysing)